jgi:hypothetical protein
MNEKITAKLADTAFDIDGWFAKLDGFRDIPFMPEGRRQPRMPLPRKIFDHE